MALRAGGFGRWFLVAGIAISLGCTTEGDSGGSGDVVQTDLAVAYSMNGADWSDPASLNADAGTDLGSDHAPQATADASGTLLAVWHSSSFAEPARTDWDILLARSTDGGATWVDQAELNTNAASDLGGDEHPQVLTDGNGNWLAVWQSWDSLGDTIGTDADILFAVWTDGDLSWTDPAPLNTNAAIDHLDNSDPDDVEQSSHDFAPQVATDGNGGWVAVWSSSSDLGETIGSDFDILFAVSTNNGLSWTDPAPLNTNAASDGVGDLRGGDILPQVAAAGSGDWIAVWQSFDLRGGTGGPIGPDSDILFARGNLAGSVLTWTAPSALNTNAATDHIGDTPGSRTESDDYAPQLAMDGSGNWIAVWDSFEPLGQGLGTDLDILMARSADNGLTWSPPAALNTNAASDTGDDSDPQLATDGAGSWIAVWESKDSLGGTIGTDSDILMAGSPNNGSSWSAPAALNTDAASDTGSDDEPQLTYDGQGNWISVWRTDRAR